MEVRGCDITHEDLKNNIWYNRKEIDNNGIDDDQNGYIDDYRGWDVLKNNDQYLTSTASHGTGVCSIIGGEGNNGKGISGVNWNVKMMVIGGVNSEFGIMKAYEYIFKMRKSYNQTLGSKGAFIVASNASLGLVGVTSVGQAVSICQSSINPVYDSLGKVGVLSVTAVPNAAIDVDARGDVLTSCERKYMISVTNSDSLDKKNSGAAFGKTTVDLAAPGTNIFKSTVNNSYNNENGTSFAAPQVAGGIALLYSIPSLNLANRMRTYPEATTRLMRNIILQGVDKIQVLNDLVVTGGRLNLYNSLNLLRQEVGGSVGDLTIQNLYPNPTHSRLTLQYETPEIKPYQVFIFNILGQLVQQETLNPTFMGKKEVNFSVSQLSAGIYFIAIKDENKLLSSKKFIVY